MADPQNIIRGKSGNGNRGSFAGYVNSAPDADQELGAAPALPPVLVVPVKVQWVEKNVIPPRARKPRDVHRPIETEVEVPLYSSDQAPVGFVTTERDLYDDVKETEYRTIDGDLYTRLNVVFAGRDKPGPLETTAENVIRTKFHAYEQEGPTLWDARNEEDAKRQAQERVDEFISIDGVLWSKADEPVYFTETYGFGRNHGGTSLRIGSASKYRNPHGEDKPFPENVFPADQREEAVAYAIKVAEERGDNGSLDHIRDAPLIQTTDEFVPGSTFTQAPRIEYEAPFQAWIEYQHQGDTQAIERAFTGFKQQLLTIPGAVIDVPDGWGGMTKKVVESKLSEAQYADYKTFVDYTEKHPAS